MCYVIFCRVIPCNQHRVVCCRPMFFTLNASVYDNQRLLVGDDFMRQIFSFQWTALVGDTFAGFPSIPVLFSLTIYNTIIGLSILFFSFFYCVVTNTLHRLYATVRACNSPRCTQTTRGWGIVSTLVLHGECRLGVSPPIHLGPYKTTSVEVKQSTYLIESHNIPSPPGFCDILRNTEHI